MAPARTFRGTAARLTQSQPPASTMSCATGAEPHDTETPPTPPTRPRTPPTRPPHPQSSRLKPAQPPLSSLVLQTPCHLAKCGARGRRLVRGGAGGAGGGRQRYLRRMERAGMVEHAPQRWPQRAQRMERRNRQRRCRQPDARRARRARRGKDTWLEPTTPRQAAMLGRPRARVRGGAARH